MTEREYTIIRTLENTIAVAENNNQNILFVTLDVMKEILSFVKEQEYRLRVKDKLSSFYGIQEGSDNGKTI